MRPLAAFLVLVGSLYSFSLIGTANAGPVEEDVFLEVLDRCLIFRVAEVNTSFSQGDFEASCRLIKQLAEQGSPDAQYYLSIFYDLGKGVPQDKSKALQWLRKSAEQGYAYAQYQIGIRYTYGEDLPQNDGEAAKWYKKAADQGDGYSQIALGFLHWYGRGVPQDDVLAHMWLDLAASRLPSWDRIREDASRIRDDLASGMTPSKIAEAQRRARAWKPEGERERY